MPEPVNVTLDIASYNMPVSEFIDWIRGGLGGEFVKVADDIEAQIKPAIEEPTGDCVVFFSIRHPRQGVAWAADDGKWEDGTGFSLSWEQLVGDAKPEDILLYRRVEYPEVLRVGVGDKKPQPVEELVGVLSDPNWRRGPRFCDKTPNCRMAAGHNGGCERS